MTGIPQLVLLNWWSAGEEALTTRSGAFLNDRLGGGKKDGEGFCSLVGGGNPQMPLSQTFRWIRELCS